MLLVYRYRVKSLTGLLNSQARACNFVWNFCNETQQHALKWNKRWPSGFDLNRLTAGSSKDLALHAGTIKQHAPLQSDGARGLVRGSE
jgi:putative transposase